MGCPLRQGMGDHKRLIQMFTENTENNQDTENDADTTLLSGKIVLSVVGF
jgi:hypothetical protein